MYTAKLKKLVGKGYLLYYHNYRTPRKDKTINAVKRSVAAKGFQEDKEGLNM